MSHWNAFPMDTSSGTFFGLYTDDAYWIENSQRCMSEMLENQMLIWQIFQIPKTLFLAVCASCIPICQFLLLRWCTSPAITIPTNIGNVSMEMNLQNTHVDANLQDYLSQSACYTTGLNKLWFTRHRLSAIGCNGLIISLFCCPRQEEKPVSLSSLGALASDCAWFDGSFCCGSPRASIPFFRMASEASDSALRPQSQDWVGHRQ